MVALGLYERGVLLGLFDQTWLFLQLVGLGGVRASQRLFLLRHGAAEDLMLGKLLAVALLYLIQVFLAHQASLMIMLDCIRCTWSDCNSILFIFRTWEYLWLEGLKFGALLGWWRFTLIIQTYERRLIIFHSDILSYEILLSSARSLPTALLRRMG